MAFNTFDNSWPDEVQSESITFGSSKGFHLIQNEWLITQKGLFKKQNNKNKPYGLHILGPKNTLYAPEGFWSFYYNNEPWLEGTLVDGNMSGDWKLYEHGQTKNFITANFCSLFNKTRKQNANWVSPFYLDLEGRGQNDIVYFWKGGLLVLDGKTHTAVIDLDIIPVAEPEGSTWKPEYYSQLPVISTIPIWKNGPYCFWYDYSVGLPLSPDEENDQGWIPHMSYLAFYAMIKGKPKLVFLTPSLMDYSKIDLKKSGKNGYATLDLLKFTAKWDKQKECFIDPGSKKETNMTKGSH